MKFTTDTKWAKSWHCEKNAKQCCTCTVISIDQELLKSMADYQLGEVEHHPMTLHNDLEESIVSPSLMLHNMAGGGGYKVLIVASGSFLLYVADGTFIVRPDSNWLVQNPKLVSHLSVCGEALVDFQTTKQLESSLNKLSSFYFELSNSSYFIKSSNLCLQAGYHFLCPLHCFGFLGGGWAVTRGPPITSGHEGPKVDVFFRLSQEVSQIRQNVAADLPLTPTFVVPQLLFRLRGPWQWSPRNKQYVCVADTATTAKGRVVKRSKLNCKWALKWPAYVGTLNNEHVTEVITASINKCQRPYPWVNTVRCDFFGDISKRSEFISDLFAFISVYFALLLNNLLCFIMQSKEKEVDTWYRS